MNIITNFLNPIFSKSVAPLPSQANEDLYRTLRDTKLLTYKMKIIEEALISGFSLDYNKLGRSDKRAILTLENKGKAQIKISEDSGRAMVVYRPKNPIAYFLTAGAKRNFN